MQTRREILKTSLGLAFGFERHWRGGLQIVARADCLSQESARGFAMAAKHGSGRGIVVCGAHRFAPELLERAEGGEWIIWEAAPRCEHQSSFGITIGPAKEPGMYIAYERPSVLTRSFLAVHAVRCADCEVLARQEGMPVAVTRRVRRGGIVVLGSMLGPNLYAEEPQAHQIFTSILQRYIH